MSVGIIAFDECGKILLIQRAREPFGFAPPAGHLDGLTYPVACFKEFEEETGLAVRSGIAPQSLLVPSPKKLYKCWRLGGDYHFWQIFKVEWQGVLRTAGTDEVISAGWYAPEAVRRLMCVTKHYLRDLKLADHAEEESWVEGIKRSVEARWQANPGLEPVWYEFFQEVPELKRFLEV